jgi:hypothetical protein
LRLRFRSSEGSPIFFSKQKINFCPEAKKKFL